MSVDVLVVGGGLIGGSIAWRLAQKGMRVTLLEAGDFGGQASYAGAGMLTPGGECEADSPLLRMALESLELYPDFVRELEEESGCAIDFRRSGAIEAAYSESEWTALQMRARKQQALGIAVEEAMPTEAAPGALGGLFYPADAQTDPRTILPALRSAATRRGVAIIERSPVRRIVIHAGHAEVFTAIRSYSAGAVVLAAGAWSAALIPSLPLPPSFPVKGQLIGYDLAPGALKPILRRGHLYLLQRASGFLIAGASTEPGVYDHAVSSALTDDLHERAAALWPALRDHKPTSAWTGLRPATTGELPQTGRWSNSPLWLAYGHYRNGILLAPHTARAIAEGLTSSAETEPACSSGTR